MAGVSPGDDEAAVAERRDRRTVLTAIGCGVDQELFTTLGASGGEDLAADGTATGIATRLAGVSPGDDEAAVAERRDRGIVLTRTCCGVDQELRDRHGTHLTVDAEGAWLQRVAVAQPGGGEGIAEELGCGALELEGPGVLAHVGETDDAAAGAHHLDIRELIGIGNQTTGPADRGGGDREVVVVSGDAVRIVPGEDPVAASVGRDADAPEGTFRFAGGGDRPDTEQKQRGQILVAAPDQTVGAGAIEAMGPIQTVHPQQNHIAGVRRQGSGALLVDQFGGRKCVAIDHIDFAIDGQLQLRGGGAEQLSPVHPAAAARLDRVAHGRTEPGGRPLEHLQDHRTALQPGAH